MKIASATIFGLIVGLALGVIGAGKVNLPVESEITGMIRQYAWWIVVLSMLAPLWDYATGVRTTMMGVITRHPYRHWAGFFTGLAVGMGLVLLLAPKFL
jgi:hypothetical protein